MQRHRGINSTIWSLFLVPCFLLLTGCDTFTPSVPAYAVNVSIDRQMGDFISFVPENINAYVTVDREGYHYNGKLVQRLSVIDKYGCAGVVVYIDMMKEYRAFDLCCPNCASFFQPCEMDGLFAICPRCGEHYDLSSGTAVPQKGIAHESLRKLPLYESGSKIIVKQ